MKMLSVEPKYMPNGSGRDSFIYQESRRYKSQSKLPFSQFRSEDGGMAPMVFNLKPVRKLNMNLLPRALQYHGDGSGRDKYVLDRYGGYVNNFNPQRNVFEKFFGIRDQEIVRTTLNRQKSPQQIKKEHMTTTIPMFAENISKYKTVRKQYPSGKLETMFDRRGPEVAATKIKFEKDVSLDLFNNRPNDQNGIYATEGSHQPPALNNFHYKKDLMRSTQNLPSKENFEADHSATAQGEFVMKQRLDDYLKGPAPLSRKTVNNFKVSSNTASSKALKANISASHLHSGESSQKALIYSTYPASPKWAQVKEKNIRYPHIC